MTLVVLGSSTHLGQPTRKAFSLYRVQNKLDQRFKGTQPNQNKQPLLDSQKILPAAFCYWCLFWWNSNFQRLLPIPWICCEKEMNCLMTQRTNLLWGGLSFPLLAVQQHLYAKCCAFRELTMGCTHTGRRRMAEDYTEIMEQVKWENETAENAHAALFLPSCINKTRTVVFIAKW